MTSKSNKSGVRKHGFHIPSTTCCCDLKSCLISRGLCLWKSLVKYNLWVLTSEVSWLAWSLSLAELGMEEMGRTGPGLSSQAGPLCGTAAGRFITARSQEKGDQEGSNERQLCLLHSFMGSQSEQTEILRPSQRILAPLNLPSIGLFNRFLKHLLDMVSVLQGLIAQ